MRKTTRILHLLLFLAPSVALAGKPPKPLITIPLAGSPVKQVNISHGLVLSAESSGRSVNIKVVPNENTPYPLRCFNNLATWASHGPDESSIWAWQVVEQFFPNTRVISICGFPLQLVVHILHPKLAGGPKPPDKYFVGGTLTVAVEPGKKSDLGYRPNE